MDPDRKLEAEINRAYLDVLQSKDQQQLANNFDRMRELIAQRSPARVEQMEREKGLCR